MIKLTYQWYTLGILNSILQFTGSPETTKTDTIPHDKSVQLHSQSILWSKRHAYYARALVLRSTGDVQSLQRFISFPQIQDVDNFSKSQLFLLPSRAHQKALAYLSCVVAAVVYANHVSANWISSYCMRLVENHLEWCALISRAPVHDDQVASVVRLTTRTHTLSSPLRAQGY